jgi:hypothetical protein
LEPSGTPLSTNALCPDFITHDTLFRRHSSTSNAHIHAYTYQGSSSGVSCSAASFPITSSAFPIPLDPISDYPHPAHLDPGLNWIKATLLGRLIARNIPATHFTPSAPFLNHIPVHKTLTRRPKLASHIHRQAIYERCKRYSSLFRRHSCTAPAISSLPTQKRRLTSHLVIELFHAGVFGHLCHDEISLVFAVPASAASKMLPLSKSIAVSQS